MDKAIRKSFIILCLSASLCGAQPEQELFVRGNKAYEQNQWGEALRSYEEISKKGCAVWYNMGNCFYKKGNGSQAIICWKRAMPGASVDEQLNIAKNLRSAYEKLGYKKDGPVYTLFEQWAYRLPLLPLQLFFLLCWYALWIIPLVFHRSVIHRLMQRFPPRDTAHEALQKDALAPSPPVLVYAHTNNNGYAKYSQSAPS